MVLLIALMLKSITSFATGASSIVSCALRPTHLEILTVSQVV